MESIASLLEAGSEVLRNAGIPDPRREASSLMEHAIGRRRAFILAHPEHVPGADEKSSYREFIRRRSDREPFHYITGVKEFFGLEFSVSPAVLIPRPETEILVERAILRLSGREKPRFCEVGVGSGCISIALLANLPAAEAVGLEISPDAIRMARTNSIEHGVASRLDLRESNVFEALGHGEKFDVIVSNPPYVPAADLGGLQPEVRDFEPHQALTDQMDGMSIIQRLIHEAPAFLNREGTLMFEFGFAQGEQVRGTFSPEIWTELTFQDDLQGIPRIAAAILAK
ncbi:MAG: peptide chain release factor N(5)-glutamine methyltransferase [Acidobacteria bacterium]|nr:peptide chain release factor N(5)-glutamine methyltransferase [Acidobacteriota bacterium]